ncbi:MAG: ketoacyl-ACP synthase III [Bacteroidota bacterium]|nr:ketoacyl-ACP synthase III [Bacteroidota bacterium]
MESEVFSIITGTGSYIPSQIIKNEDFLNNTFFNSAGEKIPKENSEIIDKFQKITGIEERRYIEDNHVTSDIGFFAAQKAIETSSIDKESLDYIIVAHNFGDVEKSNNRSDIVPSIAARIKYKLGINNPFTVAYDLPFGCPGWLQGVIQADYFIKSGDAKKILVIGVEALSRVSDPHDIDSMIYSDGAGATILEASKSKEAVGILTHSTRSDTKEFAHLLKMDKSYNPDSQSNELFLKMNGRKLYEYAITTVPQLVKDSIDKIGYFINDIKKILIHQANEKMDDAIVKRLFRLYDIKQVPQNIMPMIIKKIGNNSVATLPILYDLLINGKIENQSLNSKDNFVFASVGAGMNVNALVYKMP